LNFRLLLPEIFNTLQSKRILSVVGARPNFIKIAPIHYAFQPFSKEFEHLICHTGQHFDNMMSKVFFDELEIPPPDFFLGVGSGSHAVQTARIMEAFENVVNEVKPALVVVPGDVNSTLACSLVASKLHFPVAHVEAGLRSFDRKMPEEINRILTDVISDLLFVTEKSGLKNLKNEGISDKKVFFTGNVMIDSLAKFLIKAQESVILEKLNCEPDNYVIVTFHRPSNVDERPGLTEVVNILNELAKSKKVVFAVHPRTKANLQKFHLINKLNENIITTEPIGYIDFLALVSQSTVVITDSGGIQEETTFMQIPCITVRDTTERPITVELGTNYLIGRNFEEIMDVYDDVLTGHAKKGQIPPLWDGHAAERIVKIIMEKV